MFAHYLFPFSLSTRLCVTFFLFCLTFSFVSPFSFPLTSYTLGSRSSLLLYTNHKLLSYSVSHLVFKGFFTGDLRRKKARISSRIKTILCAVFSLHQLLIGQIHKKVFLFHIEAKQKPSCFHKVQNTQGTKHTLLFKDDKIPFACIWLFVSTLS